MNLYKFHSIPEQLHLYDDLGGLLDERGNVTFKNKDGRIHRDGDKPAVILTDGTKKWYRNGRPHRDGDEPAVILPDGTKKWHKNGGLHRDNDLPAIIYSDGTMEWYKNDRRHRDGDKPAVIHADGYKSFWNNGVIVTDKSLIDKIKTTLKV